MLLLIQFPPNRCKRLRCFWLMVRRRILDFFSNHCSAAGVTLPGKCFGTVCRKRLGLPSLQVRALLEKLLGLSIVVSMTHESIRYGQKARFSAFRCCLFHQALCQQGETKSYWNSCSERSKLIKFQHSRYEHSNLFFPASSSCLMRFGIQ